MTENNSRKRILEAVKKRVKESDEHDRISIVSNIIGDRRDRDLVDFISQLEQDYSWSAALDPLVKARRQKYNSPMGKKEAKLEELKYREVVFELLSCSGLEPVAVDTESILNELYSEDSLVDASRVLVENLENLAINQIESGDTLFFDFSDNLSVSQEAIELLQQTRKTNFQNISVTRDEATADVGDLWYCESGRLAMARLGIKNRFVDIDTLNLVLSVIHEKVHVKNTKTLQTNEESDYPHPSNDDYRKLLTQLINQDMDRLSLHGSRHAIPTLNVLLDEALSQYQNSPSASGFKKILDCINTHITVRYLDSIISLQKASDLKDSRIATLSILAIGNYYHESAVSTLIDILCKKTNREILDTSMRAIENIYKKCPEADHVISNRLDEECTNRGRLVKLLKQLRKMKIVYYQ
ncbi:MAG: hypothetical protein ACFFCP_01830 [Promethearchaeota archaeon]